MFGNNMMEKLMQMQQEAEKAKEKLENMRLIGESGGQLIVIELNGNRKLQKLSINADLQSIDKEDLEDLLSVALERALDAANKANEQEMAASARGIIPGM